jgi:hypothetical protein
MAHCSRKSDPQLPPTDELPSFGMRPAPAPPRTDRPSELVCEKCGAANDPWRRAVTQYWCGGKMRVLHWACRDVIELEMAGKLLSHALRSPRANKQTSITNTARGGIRSSSEETNHEQHLDLDLDCNSTAAATGRLTFPRV